MRKHLILFFLLISTSDVFSCDVCGCANGFSFAGILPQSNRTFLGLRYKNFSYISHPDSKILQSKENFQQTELWFRFFPIQKVQLIGVIPYSFNKQFTASQTIVQTGISDPTILIQYALLNTLNDEENHSVNHILTVGGGIKAPLGKFNYDLTNLNEVANPNFQLGTGSWDEIFTIQHTMRFKRIGFSTELQYRLNGKNKNDYQFGNRNSIAFNTFYQLYLPKAIQLNPIASFSLENWDPDKRIGIKNDLTGGQMNWMGMGFDISQKRKAIQVMFQVPIHQRIGNGELQVEPRLFLQLNYFL